MAPQTATFIKKWLPLILLLGAMIAFFWGGGWNYISLDRLAQSRSFLASFVTNYYAIAALLYLVMYSVAIALSLPGGALFTITGGFLFGWLIGGLLTLCAATAGATLLFLIARSALGESLAARAGPRLEKLRQGFQQNAFNYLLFLRLVPAFPFWLVNLAPALLNVPLATYVAATFIGIMPGTFAFAFLGSGLDGIIAAEEAAYQSCLAAGGADMCRFEIRAGSLLSSEILLAFTLLGVIALLPALLRIWRARRSNSAP